MTEIVLKRVYEDPSVADGFRVLVDKLWPRGMSRERLPYDLWAKDIAPSDRLREWYHADREDRWDEFSQEYRSELEKNQAMKEFEEIISAKKKVTLLYAAKDTAHNHAIIIKSVAEADAAKKEVSLHVNSIYSAFNHFLTKKNTDSLKSDN